MKSEHIKAVVFTACEVPDKILGSEMARERLTKEWELKLRDYNSCTQVKLVYVFITDGYRGVLASDKPWTNLQKEHLMRKVLREAIAREKMEGEVQIVGVDELRATLFHLETMAEDESHVKLSQLLLAGEKSLYYDSPKAIEAIIRLARGEKNRDEELIFRLDDDVIPNSIAIENLITYYKSLPEDQKGKDRYHFFSGGYAVNHENYDLINDFSIRINHFAPLGQINFQSNPNDPVYQAKYDTAKQWLDDLKYIGADPYNHTISGAGLTMSLRAIKSLPPFTNMHTRIIWIDDHLKRILHEALHHLPMPKENGDDTQSHRRCLSANFKQNRNPDGMNQKEIDWGKENYLERLVRGCLMDAVIQGGYGEFLRENAVHPLPLFDKEFLMEEYSHLAESRLEEITDRWSHRKYEPYPLGDFVKEKLKPEGSMYIDEIFEDFHQYHRLLRQWPKIVRLIENLLQEDEDNEWLFRSI